jgi:hypothetical protein
MIRKRKLIPRFDHEAHESFLNVQSRRTSGPETPASSPVPRQFDKGLVPVLNGLRQRRPTELRIL